MAHVMKIKAPSVSPLVDHYERVRPGTFDRSNIDATRTHLNYNLAPSDVKEDVRLAMAEHERTAGRAVRKDANVLFDWVVTLPKDCPPESAREFFSGVLEFVQGRYGAGNVLGAYVHMDETTPHVHVPVLPMIDGKLQASKMITRNDLMRFHGELGEFMDARLGFHVSIELDEQQRGEKQLSHLSQRDYIAAKDEIAATKTRLEHLRREVKALEPAAQSLPESARAILAGRSDGGREKALTSEIEYLRERISAAEDEKAELAGEIRELERGISRLERGIIGARERVQELVAQVRGYVEHVGERVAAVLAGFGVRAYAGAAPLSERLGDVRDASRELGRADADQERGRGWDMLR